MKLIPTRTRSIGAVAPLLLCLTACMEQGPDMSETMSARANIPNQVLEVNNTVVERRQYSA